MEQKQPTSRRQPGRYQKKSSSDGWTHILLFYILPFLVFNGILFYIVTAAPRLSLTVAESEDYLSTEVTLKVESWFPTKSVTMTIDGEPVELTKGKGRTYSVKVYKNGSIDARVTNLNGMPGMITGHINAIDENAPTFDDSKLEDGILTVSFSDTQSGVDFDSIYALDSDGAQIRPTMLNPEINAKAFTMDPKGTQVYAKDKAGNEVHQSFTSHKEGSKGVLDSSGEESAKGSDNTV